VAVTAGQSGGWTPIGVEQTATGYEVAWKMRADQYVQWTTEANGNVTSQSGVMSDGSSALAAPERRFDQNLNDDAGVTAFTSIEADGSTSLPRASQRHEVLSWGTSVVSFFC
jgi:serralysin